MDPLLNDFKQHLIASGKSEDTASLYAQRIARFLSHADWPPEKITAELVRTFLNRIKDKRTKRGCAMAVQQFLKFTAAHSTLISREDQSSKPPGEGQQETVPPQQWLVEKLVDEKARSDELIATLARKLMDHYLYFQRRIKAEQEDPDYVCRLADEAKQLIESNLALFIRLFSSGREVDRTIPECCDAAVRRIASQS
ncbi:MAG TPA: phage integrase N-terminal SAM-like domain-containing protein [Candidatus Binatia bacterium]